MALSKIELTEHAVQQLVAVDLSVQLAIGLARASAPYTSEHGPWNRRNGDYLFEIDTYGRTKVIQQVGRFAEEKMTAVEFLREAERHLKALLGDLLDEGPAADTDEIENFLHELQDHLGD